MHGLDACGAEVGFQTEVEVGRIDADEDAGLVLQQARTQPLADADDLGQAAHQFEAVAMHGELVAGPPGVKAAPSHLRPADALADKIRPQVAQAIQQQTCQQIARGLARHHGDAGGLTHARVLQRAMPATELARKASISATSCAASGYVAGSCRMAARACSSVSPWR